MLLICQDLTKILTTMTFFFLKKTKKPQNFDYLKYLRSIINYTKTEVMLDALLAGQY